MGKLYLTLTEALQPFMPLPEALKELLAAASSINDDKCKSQLRAYLKAQPHDSLATLSSLQICIAEHIVEQDEPILGVLIPELDTEQALELTEVTEYQTPDKRRHLKNLSCYVLDEQRTQVISCIERCETALSNATALDIIELAEWDEPLIKECMDYIASLDKVWVTPAFAAKHDGDEKNTLLYELQLLEEFLRNGGVTRTGTGDHYLAAKKIADLGIDRFYDVWFSLAPATRALWEGKIIRDTSFSRYTLGSILYRLFLGREKTLEENDSYHRAQSIPVVNFACVDVMSERIALAISQHSEAAQVRLDKAFETPFVLLESFETKKQKILRKIKNKRLDANPVEKANTIAEFCDHMERDAVTALDQVNYCMTHSVKINSLIQNEDDLLCLVNALKTDALSSVIKLINHFSTHRSMILINRMILQIAKKEDIGMFTDALSAQILLLISEDELKAGILQEVKGSLALAGKSLLYIACKNGYLGLAAFFLTSSKSKNWELLNTPEAGTEYESPLWAASLNYNKVFFKYIVKSHKTFYEFERLINQAIDDYYNDMENASPLSPLLLREFKLYEENASFVLEEMRTVFQDYNHRPESPWGLSNAQRVLYASFCHDIKRLPLAELLLLSKLMTQIQGQRETPPAEVNVDNVSYNCLGLNLLRKQNYRRTHTSYGNTDYWKLTVAALKNQIRFQILFNLGLGQNRVGAEEYTGVLNFFQLKQTRSMFNHNSRTNDTLWLEQYIENNEGQVFVKGQRI